MKFLSRKLIVALLGVGAALLNHDWELAGKIVMTYLGVQGASDVISTIKETPNQ